MTSNEAPSAKPNAPEVLKWMRELNDWFSVGEKLGVRFGKLAGLEERYPTEAEKAREEMVDSWLAKDPNPTWARLADAFEYAGQRAIARRIRETYNCPKKQPQMRRVVTVTQRTYTYQTEEPAPTPPGPETSYPKPPPSPPPPPPPYRMRGNFFECRCRNFRPIISSIKDPRGIKGIFLPYVPMSPPYRVPFELKQKKECDEMTFQFGAFVSRILRSLKSRSVSPSSVVRCLLNFGALPSSDSRPQIPLLSHRSEQLRRASTVDEVILLISDYVSFFNHTLMVYLVKELGSDDDQEELDTFLLYYDLFSRRSVFLTPPYMYGYLWIKTDKLVVLRIDELHVSLDSSGIKGMYEYICKLCKIVRVLPHSMHLCRVDRGPIEFLFRVPPHVADEIFPLSSEQSKKLGALGVRQLHCVNYCYNRDQPIKFDSDDVATSDFLSLEEDNSEVVKKKNPSTRVQQPRPQPRPQKQKPKKVARKKSTKPRHRMLSACCNYHEQMNKIRSQSCTLVTNWDMGYDGDRDSEESVDEFLIPDAVPNIPVRQSCQRLKWRLAHTQF